MQKGEMSFEKEARVPNTKCTTLTLKKATHTKEKRTTKRMFLVYIPFVIIFYCFYFLLSCSLYFDAFYSTHRLEIACKAHFATEYSNNSQTCAGADRMQQICSEDAPIMTM